MAINDIVQTIAEARVDARSLSEFVFKPAGFRVTRRLAPTVDTLQFYINRFNSLDGDFSSSVSVALSSLNNSVAEADGKVAYIETTVQDAINNTAIEGGVLADTFVVVDATLNQRQINKGFESIADLSTINNPNDGLRVYVKSYHFGLGKGGGYFTYDSSKSSVSNGGTIFNGWVRDHTSYITPEMFGAKPNEDATDAFTAIANLDTKSISIKFDDGVQYNGNFFSTGKNIFIDGAGATLEGRLNISGTALEEDKRTLTVLPVEGSFEITLNNTDGIEEGDLLSIIDKTDYSFSNYRDYYYLGECLEVLSIEGTTVKLLTRVSNTYVNGLAALEVLVIKPASYKLENLSITNESGTPFSTKYTKQSKATSCNFTVKSNTNYASLHQFSYFDSFENNKSKNLEAVELVGQGYGTAVLGGYNTSFKGCYFYARRHASAIGSAGVSPQNKNITYTNCKMVSYGNAGNTQAADIHGHSEDISFLNCIADGGVVLGGKNSRWVGGEIASNAIQPPLAVREVPSGDIHFEDVVVINRVSMDHANPQMFKVHSSSETALPSGDINYIFKNITFHPRTKGYEAGGVILMSSGDATHFTSVLADTVKIVGGRLDYLIRTGASSKYKNITITDSCEMQLPSGAAYSWLLANNAIWHPDTRVKLPKSVIKQPITLTIPANDFRETGFVFYPRFISTPYLRVNATQISGGLCSIATPVPFDGYYTSKARVTNLTNEEITVTLSATLEALPIQKYVE